MAFESLSDKLQNVFKNLRGKGRLSEADVKAALKEVKMALLEADVSFFHRHVGLPSLFRIQSADIHAPADVGAAGLCDLA